MAKHKSFYYYKYILTDHLKQNTYVYVLAGVSCLIGIIIGIILLFGQKSYLGLLTSGNQSLIKYMSGTADTFSLFYNRLFSGLLAVLILFLCTLTYYTIFLSYAYLTYQSALCTITFGTIISMYGFSGILNVVLLLLPCNLILFACYSVILSLFTSRAKRQHKYHQKFTDSFKGNNFVNLLTIFLVTFLLVNIVLGLIVPLIIKAIFVIIY